MKLTEEYFNKVVYNLSTAIDSKGNNLDMVGLIVSQEETQYTHYFREREKNIHKRDKKICSIINK